MGQLIYCNGNKAKTPFYFQSTGIEVFTMEELCYYLYHNVETLEEDLAEPQLIPWIRDELGIADRAGFLQQLINQKSGVKDLVVSIFCSTDYYTQEEINQLIAEIDAYAELLPIERKKRHADAFLRYRKTREASLEYRNILDDRDFVNLPVREQGMTYHNLAVLLARDGLLRQASKYFLVAYQKGGEKESLCQYLYALKLGGMEKEFDRELQNYYQETDVIHRLENQFFFLEENRELSPDYVSVLRLTELRDKENDEDFWWLLDETVTRIKNEYRA